MVAGDAIAGREPPLFLPLLASIATCAVLSGLWLMSLGGLRAGFLFGLVFGGAVGMLHTLFLGIPYAMFLRRKGLFTAPWMTLGGAVIGGLPLAILSSFDLMILAPAGIGAFSAGVFHATFRRLSH